LNIDLQITPFFKNKHFELCCFVMYRVRGGQHGVGGGDQHVKESEWKMRRTGGSRRGKKLKSAMGRTRRGGAQRVHYALGSH
jgi:hypothetical protein